MTKARLRVDVLTLFPKMLEGPLGESMVKQAEKRGKLQIQIHYLRDYALDKRGTCDDKPFGGGAGMVMMIQPIYDCLKAIGGKPWVILPSPRGKRFNQASAKRLSRKRHLVFVCGHYEGIDERVYERLIDEELSLGDFVTTGGELPALSFIEAIARLVPGVLGNKTSLESESFSKNILDYPQYTRPREFKKWKVPNILFSGDHALVQNWRRKKAEELTKKLRPDLFVKAKKKI